MADHHHRWVGNLFWRMMLILAVGLAVYVSVGRALLSTLPEYQATLLASLNQNAGLALEVESLSGRLDGFAPVVILNEVNFNYDPDAGKSLYFTRASVALDPWDSLLSMSPRFTEVIIDAPEIDIDVAGNGQVRSTDLDQLADLLRAFRKIVVTNARLVIHPTDGMPLIATAQLDYRRQSRERLVRAQLDIPEVVSISVQAEGLGSPLDIDAFTGELHGVLDVVDMTQLGALFGFSAMGSANMSFWYRVNEQVPSFAATASGANLLVDLGAEKTLKLDRFATDILVERDEPGWMAQLQNSQLISAGKLFELPRIELHKVDDTARVGFSSLDVESLSNWLNGSGLLPEKAVSILAILKSSGVVDVAELRISDLTKWTENWSIIAEVSNVATQPYLGVPGLQGIDAYIEATNAGAKAWIDSDDFILNLPKVYREPLAFDRVSGILSAHWQPGMLFLEDGLLNAQRSSHDAVVQFGMDIPLRRDSGYSLNMDLMVGAQNADVSVRNDYVPYIVPPKLYNWLSTALPDGHINSVAFVWRGALKDFKSANQTMQLAADISGATVKFQPDWAPLEETIATVSVDDSRVSVFSERARLRSAFVDQTSVEVAAASTGSSRLQVTARAHDSIPGGLAILAASPLSTSVEALRRDLSATGRALVDLDLELDLNQVAETLKIDVDIAIESGSLYSRASNLEITDVNGGLDFDSATGFTSRALTGSFMNQPLDINIGYEGRDSSGVPIFVGRFAAQVGANDALKLASLGVDIPLSGSTEVMAEVIVRDTTQILITSTLAGIALALPEPIGKTAAEKTPLSVMFEIDGDTPVDVFWQGRASARGYRRAGNLVGGTLDLTPRTSAPVMLDETVEEGFYLTGYLPSLDVDQWLGKFDIQGLYNNTERSNSRLSIEALVFDSVRFGGAEIGALNLDLTPFDGWDMLGINADWLDAELTLVHGDGTADLIINTVDLDKLPKLGAMGGTPKPPRFSKPLSVVIANLQLADKSVGAASFLLSSDERQLRVYDIRGQLAAAELLEGTELIWRVGEGEQTETLLTLNSAYDDFGDTLDALELARIVDTRAGTASADLHWAGNPSDLALSSLQGDVSVSMKNGAFLPAPAGATGALKILSLLNLVDLFNRANITQLFDAGVTFERAKGQFLFDKGQLSIPGFKVDGSGGEFKFISDIDLMNEQINGDLIVTLPLVNNVPWVAALAGGLPIAAGAFLVSKIFEDQFKTLTSAVYSVSGDLAQPEVKFTRVFDVSSEKGKTVADQVSVPEDEMSNPAPVTEVSQDSTIKLQSGDVSTEQAPSQNEGGDSCLSASLSDPDVIDS